MLVNRRPKIRECGILAALFSTSFVTNSMGAVVRWSSNADIAHPYWSTATNWQNNTPPANGDAVIFDVTAAAQTTFDVNKTLSQFYFGVSGITLGSVVGNNGGATLTLSSASVTLNTGTTLAFGGSDPTQVLPINFSGNSTVSAVSSGQTIVFANDVSGSGNIIKTGLGTLRFNSDTSFSGSVTLTNGIVKSLTSGGFGTGTLIFSGTTGTLSLAAGTTISNPITLPVNVPGSVDTSGDPAMLSGKITGAGGLQKYGTATLTLSVTLHTFHGPAGNN